MNIGPPITCLLVMISLKRGNCPLKPWGGVGGGGGSAINLLGNELSEKARSCKTGLGKRPSLAPVSDLKRRTRRSSKRRPAKEFERLKDLAQAMWRWGFALQGSGVIE